MIAMFPKDQEIFPVTVDGVISSQPSFMAPYCPGIVGGWEWVDQGHAEGSTTITRMHNWLHKYHEGLIWANTHWIGNSLITALHRHYGYTSVTAVSAKKYGLKPGTLPGGGGVIKGLQNEINQWVG